MLAVGKIDPIELTEYVVARIETYGPRPVCMSTTYERARAEARRRGARYSKGAPLGPLDGIPVVWKDAIDVAGVTTTAASAIYRDADPAASDAPVVSNLAAAGMVTL